MNITLLNGRKININDYGLKLLKYFIPSVEIEHELINVNGRDGPIITDTRLKSRQIRVRFMYKTQDYTDYKLFVAEINALFTRKEAFYIVFDEDPGKRWKVKVAKQYQTNELLRKVGDLEISFICENIYAESIGTSIDLQNRKEWDANLWSYGMGLDWDKNYSYEFSSSIFVIDNIGNVDIDPCQHELEITVRATAANYLQIRNNTTGETYRFNNTLSASDTLLIKGTRTFKNGVSAFKHTNKMLLSLASGLNSFTVTGGAVLSVAFKFRFLYK